MREVITQDALDWLRIHQKQEGSSTVASMPDISEFPQFTLSDWKKWFTETASLILETTPDSGVTIFYQSDIKHEGTWVDKSFLCQKAAENLGHELLWHKILCRAPAGVATFGRPAYSHLLCFSKNLRLDLAKSTADVIPDIGQKTWPRGMGLEVCLSITKFLVTQTPTQLLFNPFCGQGSMLAAANHLGLKAIGIERSPERSKKARELKVTLDGKNWDFRA